MRHSPKITEIHFTEMTLVGNDGTNSVYDYVIYQPNTGLDLREVSNPKKIITWSLDMSLEGGGYLYPVFSNSEKRGSDDPHDYISYKKDILIVIYMNGIRFAKLMSINDFLIQHFPDLSEGEKEIVENWMKIKEDFKKVISKGYSLEELDILQYFGR